MNGGFFYLRMFVQKQPSCFEFMYESTNDFLMTEFSYCVLSQISFVWRKKNWERNCKLDPRTTEYVDRTVCEIQ
jgi:hypothetical protein